MNSLTLTGSVLGEPKVGQAQHGAAKVLFDVSSDGGEAEIYFTCLAFGVLGDRAAQLAEGDKVLLAGRLVSSKYGQAQTFILNGFELLHMQRKEDEHGHTS